MKTKLTVLWIVIAAVMITAGIVLSLGDGGNQPFPSSQPYDKTLTLEEAREDLHYMYQCVYNTHPCYLDGSGLDINFDEAYKAARQKLTDNMTVAELWAVGAEMYTSIHDGHTIITYKGSRTANDCHKLSDCVVRSVDGIAGSELLERFKKYFPYELQVEFYAENMLGTYLIYESWLTLLGIDTADGVVYGVEKEGKTEKIELFFDESDNGENAATVETEEKAYYSYTVNKKYNDAVFVLDDCIVTDGYKNALAEFFGAVKENNIENVIIDLRNNGGGNTMVIREFLRYIDTDSYHLTGGVDVREGNRIISYPIVTETNDKAENAFSGKLYALTSNYTFSSAMDFAVVISDNNLGTVVGEIPGNMPTSYGDKLTYQCKNSGLLCSVSFKKFYRVDKSKNDIPLIPDIEVDAKNALDAIREK